MQKSDYNKVVLHQLLLTPGFRPWTWALDPYRKAWTLKNLAHEKRGKQLDAKKKKKKIERPHSIIHYKTLEFSKKRLISKPSEKYSY